MTAASDASRRRTSSDPTEGIPRIAKLNVIITYKE